MRRGSASAPGPWTIRQRCACCSTAAWTRSPPTTPRWPSPCSPSAPALPDPRERRDVIFRRRRLPEHLAAPFEAFQALVPMLERAKAALTESVPGTRLPGRPLAETLWEFEEGLRAVDQGMPAWRISEVEPQWLAARDGGREALPLAPRLGSPPHDVALRKARVAPESVRAPVIAMTASVLPSCVQSYRKFMKARPVSIT